MECNLVEILAGLSVLFCAIYYYLTSQFDFWSKRGVAGAKPVPFTGTIKPVLSKKCSMGDYVTKEYQNYKEEPLFGIFALRSPVLVVKDPEFIKDVLIKDFSTFADRGRTVVERADPLSQHLFSLEPERWRPLRTSLSPIFTSGKLKEMFHVLVECADHFERFLEDCVEKDPIIECRDVTARFTTDVIGACAFGLKMNALADENSQFRKVGLSFLRRTRFKTIKQFFREFLPSIYRLLAPLMYDHEVNDFFIGIMKETLDYRRKNNVRRNDFVDLLMDVQKNPGKVNNIEMTDTIVTAQAFVFFLAGFETSSTTISHSLYELALNPSIQEKLREEIMINLKRNNGGEVKYEQIKSMEYLHKVFSETLRKYPPLSIITRATTKQYTFNGTRVTIPKGMKVLIPAYAIQRDPQIYPDPETFDPERFTRENIERRHPSFYLPFGDGPRNCIGARFANYQTKIGIIKVLKNYKVEVCDETCIPYVNDPAAFITSPIGGIKLKFTKLQ